MPPTQTSVNTGMSAEENVLTLLGGVPEAVRVFITSDAPDRVVLALTKKYQLHADQAGKLHQALLFMLLGVYSPDRFFSALAEAEFSQETIDGITADINEQVFVPLQEEERKGAAEQKSKPRPQASSAPATPIVPVPSMQAPAPLTVTTPAAVPIAPPTLQVQPPTPPQPVYIPPFAPIEPTMRTMAHDVEAMKTGTAPAPTPYTMPTAPVPAPPPAQTPPPATPPPPQTSVPVPVPSSPQIPSNPSLSTPIAPPKTFTPTHTEVVSTLQKYGIDPYREPAE